MGKVRVDEIRVLLPELDELRPLRDRLLSDSVPDPDRRWSASAELGTLGRRLVRPERLEASIPELTGAWAKHLASIYGMVVRAISSLQAGDEPTAISHFLEAAEAEEGIERLERSEAYALAAFEVARSLRDRRPSIRALRHAARAARGLGKIEEARSRYEDAYGAAVALGDRTFGAVAAIGRGNVAVDQGLWSEAESWYQGALEMLGDGKQSEHWHVYLNLSIVHRSRGELERSAEWLARAEGTAAEIGDPDAGPILGNARGQLLVASGAVEEAELLFREALEGAEGGRARVVIGVNLGESLLAQGRVLEAAEVARAAEETAIVSNVVPRLPEVYRLLGAIAGARGVEDGFVFFEQALALVDERDLPAFEAAQTLEAYGQFARSAGREVEASAHWRRAARIYEELGNRHRRERVLELMNDIQGDGTSVPPGEGSIR